MCVFICIYINNEEFSTCSKYDGVIFITRRLRSLLISNVMVPCWSQTTRKPHCCCLDSARPGLPWTPATVELQKFRFRVSKPPECPKCYKSWGLRRKWLCTQSRPVEVLLFWPAWSFLTDSIQKYLYHNKQLFILALWKITQLLH